MSEGSQSWQTPAEIVRLATRVLGNIDLDPCTVATNPVGADRVYTEADDGLSQPWYGRVFCNPPFNRIMPWVEKAIHEPCAAVFFLAPGWTSAKWWHRLSGAASARCVMLGRLNYINPETGLAAKGVTFGSCLWLVSGDARMVERFYLETRKLGEVSRASWTI